MAVINALPGLEVTIQVDGQIAQEYDPPSDNECAESRPRMAADRPALDDAYGHGHCVKYIEAIPGALFQFVVEKSSEFDQNCHYIRLKISIDGHHTGWLREVDYLRGDSTRGKAWKLTNGTTWSGNPVEGYTTFNYQFADLAIGKKDRCSPCPDP